MSRKELRKQMTFVNIVEEASIFSTYISKGSLFSPCGRDGGYHLA
jgi:hypothetical protein